jgi:hypothetical protein
LSKEFGMRVTPEVAPPDERAVVEGGKLGASDFAH